MPFEYKTDIAQRYFPRASVREARRMLNHEINATRGLLDALTEAGYHSKNHYLTPRQQEILYRFLGEP